MAKKQLKTPDLAPGSRLSFFNSMQALVLASGDRSLGDIASQIGYSHQSVYRALTGPRMPSKTIVEAIARALGGEAGIEQVIRDWQRGVAEERLCGQPSGAALLVEPDAGAGRSGAPVADSAMESSAATTHVMVIDDHEVVHAGIRTWALTEDPPIVVTGCFKDLAEYFAALQHDAHPSVDVVIFDLEAKSWQPDFAGLTRLCEAGSHVVVYSHASTDEVILTCLDIGAATYLDKSEGKRHLIEAIHAAHREVPYVGPRMAAAIYHDRALGRVNLSEREKEVLFAWFQTESKDLVARRLCISPTTVRTHLQRARAKFAAVGRPAPTKSALLARAIEDGILGLDDL